MEGKSFDDVAQKIKNFKFDEEFDLIVAIANGGIVPAALLNQQLMIDFQILKINWRDNSQKPKYESPRLLEEPGFDYKGKRILLVEDRVKTGTTLEMAKDILKGAALIKTFAVNGLADYPLYNETCFRFPWNL